MSHDVFVRWQKEVPAREEIKIMLSNYISDGAKMEDGKDRLFVVLPGKPCSPMQHKYPVPAENYHEERFFEVYFGDDNIDIITRFADEFTNVVARGFAECCARTLNGKIEG